MSWLCMNRGGLLKFSCSRNGMALHVLASFFIADSGIAHAKVGM